MTGLWLRRWALMWVWFLGLAVAVADAQIMPTFTQQLTIEPTTVGQSNQLQIMPVYDGKAWAFTARWDDNNANHLNMQKAMAGLGLKGTFYLNDSSGDFAADYAKQLSTQGCSIGGHTTHHFWLPTLNTNAIFREIMLNRIQREADSDKPINSFAFPYGSYNAWLDPDAMKYISEALIRSGYHHNVYNGFVVKNPHLPGGLFSTVNQVVPGDRQIDAEKFRAAMTKILDDPQKYQQTDYAISLGVHCWQSAEELEKFKTLLSDYAHREDFWYCNETEFAAYRLQAKHTQIKAVDNKPGSYTITRPTSIVAGNAIPLSIVITGNKPSVVTLDGQVLEVAGNGEGRWLVNLPYPVSQALPEKIDWVKCTHTSMSVSQEFPGLNFAFASYKQPSENLSVKIKNQSGKDMTDINVTIRLPPACEPGIGRYYHPKPIADGFGLSIGSLHFKRHLEMDYIEGSEFHVAQIDFKLNGQAGRVYITEDVSPGGIDTPTLRDVTHVLGPIDPDLLDWDALVAQSILGSTRVALNDTSLGKWFTADDEDRQLLSHKRFVQYNRDPEWKTLANIYSRKPALLAASLDFAITQDTELTIRSDSSIKQIAIDGQTIALSDSKTPVIKAGKHRIVLLVDTKGRKVFNKPDPVLLKITAGDQDVQYLKAN